MSGHGAGGRFVVTVEGVTHNYNRKTVLSEIDLRVPPSSVVGFIGPDGVGKSTLLGLIAGVRRLQHGRITVLGCDLSRAEERSRVAWRLAYVPQGLGGNLYPELTVWDNMMFFGRLFGVPSCRRRARAEALLDATGLLPFARRRVGRLSGGMKQKLALCCALVHSPRILVLDEPTTGIDPLSRIQFWEIVAAARRSDPEMTVLVATSYMHEAEGFDWLYFMEGGRLLAQGPPRAIKDETGASTLDEAYVRLLSPERGAERRPVDTRPGRPPRGGAVAIEARRLTKRFGPFVAVDGVDFTIAEGEIFGFVGPNGSGKTTTMKMVTGLLTPTEGTALVFGRSLDPNDIGFRRSLGYMSQTFSLYGELSVEDNLRLHARLFDVPPSEIEARVRALLHHFELEEVAGRRAEGLPLGVRQRLSLAVATIHRPRILVLDEPTSGVDPVARDRFWQYIMELSRGHGTTVFVSTHYLDEALRCDRVALMNEGRMLACEAPRRLMERVGARTMDEAFIAYISGDLERSGGEAPRGHGPELPAGEDGPGRDGASARYFSLQRLAAVVWREGLEVVRDPFRMFSALFIPVILMLIFGFGLSMDIERLPYAVLDLDHSPESREYLEQFRASRYFDEAAVVADDAELEALFRSGKVRVGLVIRDGFGKRLKKGSRPAEVGVFLDGTMPYRAQTALGYTQLLHRRYLASLAARDARRRTGPPVSSVETRFWFNPSRTSRLSFVPGLVAVVLIIIPAMLTAAAVVREKEMGSIVNFHATPLTRVEFLLGKQIPYAVVSFLVFLVLTVLVVGVFGVPLKGSFAGLAAGAVLFAFCATGVGLLVSTWTRTQVASNLATVILTLIPSFQYSGLLSPVAALEGGGRVFSYIFPTTYFLRISVASFTKGLSPAAYLGDLAALAAVFVGLVAASALMLRGQSR